MPGGRSFPLQCLVRVLSWAGGPRLPVLVNLPKRRGVRPLTVVSNSSLGEFSPNGEGSPPSANLRAKPTRWLTGSVGNEVTRIIAWQEIGLLWPAPQLASCAGVCRRLRTRERV